LTTTWALPGPLAAASNVNVANLIVSVFMH
jgi:hypothetical protein